MTTKLNKKFLSKSIMICLLGLNSTSFAVEIEGENRIRPEVELHEEMIRMNIKKITSTTGANNPKYAEHNEFANVKNSIVLGLDAIATGDNSKLGNGSLEDSEIYLKAIEIGKLKLKLRNIDDIIYGQNEGIRLDEERIKNENDMPENFKEELRQNNEKRRRYIAKKQQEKEDLNLKISKLIEEIKSNNSEKTTSGSIALGNSTLSVGDNSIAFGNNTTSLGNSSISIGDASNSEGDLNIAIGYKNKVKGRLAQKAGLSATDEDVTGRSLDSGVQKYGSISVGNLNDINGENGASFAFGNHLKGSGILIGDGIDSIFIDDFGNIREDANTTNVLMGNNIYANGKYDVVAIGNNIRMGKRTPEKFIGNKRKQYLFDFPPEEEGNNFDVILGYDSQSRPLLDNNKTIKHSIRDTEYTFAGKAEAMFSIGKGSPLVDDGNGEMVRKEPFERRLINMAAGEISETSTDGVNGSQLYAVIKELNKVNAYNSTNSPMKEGENELSESLFANTLNFVGDENITVTREGGNISIKFNKQNTENTSTPKPNAENDTPTTKKQNFEAGKNSTVIEKEDGTIVFGLANDVSLNSLNITGGIELNDNGINLNDKKIKNIANGEVSENSKEAVNGSQLHKVFKTS